MQFAAQYDRDPRRIQWLGDIVLQLPDLTKQDMSTAAEGRALSYYQILIGELSWRGCEPSAALLEHIRQHIAHPYKLVRERMARYDRTDWHKTVAVARECLIDEVAAFYSPKFLINTTGVCTQCSGTFGRHWTCKAHRAATGYANPLSVDRP